MLEGLGSGGPCQAAAWLPVWWHARDRHARESIPPGGEGLGATLDR